jgi:hypothetical protein
VSKPVTRAPLAFHVIVDDFHRTFSMDASDDANGVRLHYAMLRVGRDQNKKLRDFDIRAESCEAALAEMNTRFLDYTFLGTWSEAQGK